MRTKPAWLIAIAVFLLTGGESLFAKSPTKSWRSGRVISVMVGGHGSAEIDGKRNTFRTTNTTEIWWTYCISAEGNFYSVLSRESPAKTGLVKDRVIRFSESKNQIGVVNPGGKSVALRILSKDKSRKCP